MSSRNSFFSHPFAHAPWYVGCSRYCGCACCFARVDNILQCVDREYQLLVSIAEKMCRSLCVHLGMRVSARYHV